MIEKELCEKCGVDVRENTLFCYNCGSRVAEPVSEPAVSNGSAAEVSLETKAALDDLADKLRDPNEKGDKIARAAAQRRKARVSRRKTQHVVWEPVGGTSSVLIMGLSIFVAVIALVVVIFTVVWK